MGISMRKDYKLYVSLVELIALQTILKVADSEVLKDLTDEITAFIEEKDNES